MFKYDPNFNSIWMPLAFTNGIKMFSEHSDISCAHAINNNKAINPFAIHNQKYTHTISISISFYFDTANLIYKYKSEKFFGCADMKQFINNTQQWTTWMMGGKVNNIVSNGKWGKTSFCTFYHFHIMHGWAYDETWLEYKSLFNHFINYTNAFSWIWFCVWALKHE